MRLWVRSIKEPEYRRRILERFGVFPDRINKARRIWIHAVSVGETIAIEPLVKQLFVDFPDHVFLMTSTTPTGSQQAKKLFQGERFEHVYFPYDLPGSVNRFLTKFRPEVIVLMETEIWPNLFFYANKKGVKVMMVNARMSERSFRAYKRVKNFTSEILEKLDLIVARNDIDAYRFRNLGYSEQKIRVSGNLKFDMVVSERIQDEGRQLRQRLGTSRFIWIAASTHPGEDELVLDVQKRLLEIDSKTLLILVPRHPRRCPDIVRIIVTKGLNFIQRSKDDGNRRDFSVYIGDTIGELLKFYAATDVAFVGGSLVAIGGHNPLEPIMVGKPVLTGPYFFNFESLYGELFQQHGALLVRDAESLFQSLKRLATDATWQSQLNEAANEVYNHNRGATARTAQWLSSVLFS